MIGSAIVVIILRATHPAQEEPKIDTTFKECRVMHEAAKASGRPSDMERVKSMCAIKPPAKEEQ